MTSSLLPVRCNSALRHIVWIFLSFCLFCDADTAEEELRRVRLHAKPWYSKYIQVGGITLPFSPTSVVILFLSVFYVVYFWSGTQAVVEASHILVDDAPDAKTKLTEWKNKIGTDYALFAKYAADHSQCPSKANGGKLGRFKRMQMAPPFDQVCFDPASPVQTTLGPIQTQFGWHLIYIQDRQLPK